MSRSRDSNHLYVVAGADDLAGEEVHAHGSRPAGGATAELGQALRRSRGQHLAIEQADPAGTASHSHGDTRAEGDRLRAHRHAAVSPSATGRRNQLQQERQAAMEQAEAVRQRLEPVRERADVLRGVRRLLWRDDAHTTRNELARLAGDLDAWQRRIAALDAALDRLDEPTDRPAPEPATPDSKWLGLREAVVVAEFDPPNYILTTLGPRPDHPGDRHVWRRAVRAIETYRATWGVTDAASPFGDAPANRVQRRAYADALAALSGAQRRVPVDNSQEVMRASSRSSNDLSVGIG